MSLPARPPRPADVPAVVALQNAVHPEMTGEPEWSEADVRDTWGDLVDVTRDAWLVERDGDLAGYAALHGAGGGALLAEGCVHPDHVDHGVGGRLIDLTESRAADYAAADRAEVEKIIHPRSRQVLSSSGV